MIDDDDDQDDDEAGDDLRVEPAQRNQAKARLFAAKDETAPVRIAAGVVSVQRDGCAVA